MHQTASNTIQTSEPRVGLLRAMASAVVLGLTAVALGRALASTLAAEPPGLDDAVAAIALAGGTLAAAVMALGTTLLALGRLGRHARVLHRAGRALTPALLRRALVAGIGLSLAAAPAVADQPPDLGWQVTAEATAQTDNVPSDPVPSDSVPTDPVPTDPVPTDPVPTDPVPSDPVPALVVQAAPPATAATPAPSAPAVPVAQPSSAASTTGPTHTVRPGECLWSIAAAHLPAGATDAAIAAAWPQWYAANRAVIGADPDLLLPGQVLRVPDGASR